MLKAHFPQLWVELWLSAQIRKRHSSGSTSEDRLAACAREYVESLHQNSRIRLLYGKNNVLVQPVGKPYALLSSKGSGTGTCPTYLFLSWSLTREVDSVLY